MEISKISFPEGITATRARVQVGVAVPKRDVLLDAIGGSGQPAPGCQQNYGKGGFQLLMNMELEWVNRFRTGQQRKITL